MKYMELTPIIFLYIPYLCPVSQRLCIVLKLYMYSVVCNPQQ